MLCIYWRMWIIAVAIFTADPAVFSQYDDF